MTIIEKISKMSDEEIAPLNNTLFYAYKNARQRDFEVLDFNDVIWNDDIPEIVEFCKNNNVDKITISAKMAGIQDVISQFIKLGGKLGGMTEVDYRNPWNHELTTAFVIEF